jgi:hypothetical protein
MSDDRTTFYVANDELELTFDRATGRWLWLRDIESDRTLLYDGGRQAPVVLWVGGVTTSTRERTHWWSVVDAEPVGHHAHCEGYTVVETERGPRLTIHTREGDWRIDQTYTLVTGERRVERGLGLSYHGRDTVLLRGVELRLPSANLGPTPECYVEAPGYATRAHQPLAAVSAGDWWERIHSKSDIGGAPGWKAGLLCIDNPEDELALSAWSFSRIDPSILRVRRGDAGTQIKHVVMLADRFRGGQALQWEGQHVQVTHGDWYEALESFHAWYDEVDLVAPDASDSPTPDWARSARIYELFIGEARRPGKYPNIETLLDDLERIKDLGFNAIEIMPQRDFPSYSVVDYYDAELCYGGDETLKELTRRAHEMGMRVLLDVVLHGVLDKEATRAIAASRGRSNWPEERLPEKHPYRLEHPEWFMQTEFGTDAATYTWAFDHANPGYRDLLCDVLNYYVREYDADGFRVDALTWNYFPNWAEGLPYRASASLYASASLMERARREMREIKPDAVLYSETTGPLYAGCCDLIYNYDMQWIFSALLPPVARRGFAYTFAFCTEKMRAAELAPWLEQRRLSKPEGSITVHHLDSHDTNEWGGLMQFRREAFGEPQARALFGLCCALDGGIMVFEGAEDGDEAYYRRLLHLLADEPALRDGAADYAGASADDADVFTCLRQAEGQAIVPVVYLGEEAATVNLRVSSEGLPFGGERFRLVDRMTDEDLPGPDGPTWTAGQLDEIAVAMEPFQVRMLEIVTEG